MSAPDLCAVCHQPSQAPLFVRELPLHPERREFRRICGPCLDRFNLLARAKEFWLKALAAACLPLNAQFYLSSRAPQPIYLTHLASGAKVRVALSVIASDERPLAVIEWLLGEALLEAALSLDHPARPALSQVVPGLVSAWYDRATSRGWTLDLQGAYDAGRASLPESQPGNDDIAAAYRAGWKATHAV